MTNAVWAKATGEIISVSPKNGTDFQLEELQKFVDGFIEIVNLHDGYIMVVNDNGALIPLPYNPVATVRCGMREPIFGDILICKGEMVR